MRKNITIREKYSPAMEITDQEEADEYFEELVTHNMSFGSGREEAERIERTNLGYFAGYYNHETRLRVEKLFNCSHPFFGEADKGEPALEEAFEIGKKIGESIK